MTGEERGREFLEFVAENMARLKANLRKNITFDERIFEDVFGETVLKVYEAIVKRNLTITDYEQYFFISSKWNYINTENRLRRNDAETLSLTQLHSLEKPEEETAPDGIPGFVDFAADLCRQFGEEEAALFIDYSLYKARGKASYRKYALLNSLSLGTVSSVVCKIRKALKNRKGNGLDKET